MKSIKCFVRVNVEDLKQLKQLVSDYNKHMKHLEEPGSMDVVVENGYDIVHLVTKMFKVR